MFRRVAISVVILAGSAGLALAAGAGARERCIGESAVDIDMRISACTTVIEASSIDSEDLGIALANRGTAYLNKQYYVPAIGDYDRAEQLRPDDVNIFQGRCLARAVINVDLDGALADCNKALELLPSDARILGYRGLVNLRLEQNKEAAADYSAALEGDPKNAEYLFGRGQAKLREGDEEGGEADVAAAHAINPKIAEDFAKLERDESMWSWVALLDYWRSIMRMIY